MISPLSVRYPAKAERSEIEVAESSALYDDVNDAVKACAAAQVQYAAFPLSTRKKLIQAIRDVSLLFRYDLAWSAWSETGRGRFPDKVLKHCLAAESTPGVEDLQPQVFTGDAGATVIDLAPFGVLAAVTPVTNPTATIINNSITILSGGNGVVFNPHPAAALCTNRAVAIVNQTIVALGAPPGLVASVRVPTIASGLALMTHPLIAANLITGGPAVVKVALKSGKRSWCAGPGNPPVIVDETADIELAAQGLYQGASFDNNMICSDEKEVFVVESQADALAALLVKQGAYLLDASQLDAMTNLLFAGNPPAEFTHGQVDKDIVGRDTNFLLKKIGVSCTGNHQLAVAFVPKGHPLVWTEQLCPVLPLVKVADFEEALSLARQAEHGYKHTASIYSQNLGRVGAAAKALNTAIFVANGPHTSGLGHGGEGYGSFSIAGCTGEGMTRPSTFVRERRVVCVNSLRFV
eukprot:Gregarina_sp_Poly_1__6980@NODE_37_length_18459_cov_169_892127_g32_i0_p4_GENE_NODE_37_length_18459_cov_169_892127_g32_i0NODE_37_length_18459_cov_169_892127_g32_i0_p4_ORF_typecomplete_len465_score61_21Aldedh/PF00171_22/2_9e51_NODE_37_length_18459_cov_169_892127_g32_i01624417638